MALLPDAVCFSQPGQNLAIKFGARVKTETVHVITRRETVDFREAGICEMAGQHDVANDPVSLQAHRREAHSYLKCYARFLRDDAHTATALDQLRKLSKQGDG